MSILENLFKKQKINNAIQEKEHEPAEMKPQQPEAASPVKTEKIYAEQALKAAQEKMPNARIEYYFDIKNSIDSTWTAHQKAYLYYLVACSVGAGAADTKYKESNLRLAFYAAQLFFEPDAASAGWQQFLPYGFKASDQNARKLHEAYPLPETLIEAQNYKVPVIHNDEK